MRKPFPKRRLDTITQENVDRACATMIAETPDRELNAETVAEWITGHKPSKRHVDRTRERLP